MDWLVAEKLALALGLGLLVGFQREWTAPHVAGIRTFALITVLGALNGLLSDSFGVWIVAAGLISLTAVMLVGGYMKYSGLQTQPGLTTQVSALMMYSVGVAISANQIPLGAIVAGGVAVLLQWKQPLHGFVERVGKDDMRAIFQLVLIGLIVLPIMPNREFGPYHVLNPYQIWLMVVLICGISAGSFLAYKFLGTQAGTVLGGVLGGLISSTATTVSYSRLSKKSNDSSGLASLVIMVASTIVFGRVIVEVAIIAPQILPQILPPLAIMMVLMILISAAVYSLVRDDLHQVSIEEDPSDLRSALLFGMLYGAVLLAVAVTKEHFGKEALYGVAALSGLTDMDAITLSTAQMIKADRLSIDTGWRMILTGGLSNLLFKGLAVGFLGSRQLLKRMSIVLGLSFAGGLLLLIFWP